jgi:tetratricopeptide (TPR) repeat protein
LATISNLDDRLKSLLTEGRHGEVIELYESMPAEEKAKPETQNLFACALIMAGDNGRAFDFLKSIPNDLKNLNIWNNLCLAGIELEKFGATLSLLDAALKKYPKDPALLLGRARCLGELGRPEEAYDAARAALDIGETDDAFFATGLATELIGRYDEAMAFYRGALRLNPTHGAAANNLNDLCWRFRRFEGLRELAEARMHSPTNQAEYARYRATQCKAWTGGSLQGRRLHVIADQGVGDQIMFTQFLRRLGDFNPAQVIVYLDRRLVPLFREAYRSDFEMTFESFAMQIDCRPTDMKTSLSSLPNYLVRSIKDFARTPFLSVTSEDGDFRGGDFRPVFGLSWWSAGLASKARSLDVDELADVLRTTEARYFSLQYRPADAGIERLKQLLGDQLLVSDELDCTNDFVRLAKTCLRLDGILTVDQALVHVAGAVGAPVDVLLPPNPNWRYGSPDGTMLWYGDHVRLIRHTGSESLKSRIDSFLARINR